MQGKKGSNRRRGTLFGEGRDKKHENMARRKGNKGKEEASESGNSEAASPNKSLKVDEAGSPPAAQPDPSGPNDMKDISDGELSPMPDEIRQAEA